MFVAFDVRAREQPRQPYRRNPPFALDDDAAKPQFVRTMHRFGYRFVGPVDDGIMSPAEVPTAANYWLVLELRQVSFERRGKYRRARERTHPYGSTRRASPGITRESRSAAVTATIEDLGSKNGTFVGR